jgi:transcriptional activator SPT7
MKYLLQAIEAKRAAVKLDDGELRELLTEVCKGRDEREEFLESIDRIITELKNYTEHSTAFLSKVSKRDAPDYYDVIKHPMDLGSMQKKVKSGQYKTKKQFAHDLNLIWDNCLLYNSDPTHPLRRNVQFMRKKADHLLEFISDKSDVKSALVQWGLHDSKPTPASGAVNGHTTDAANAASGAQEPANGNAAAQQAEAPRRRNTSHIAFEEQEAFVRTPHSMLAFANIDAGLQQLEHAEAGPSSRPLLAPSKLVDAMAAVRDDAHDDPLSSVLPGIFAAPSSKGKEKATPEVTRQSQPPSQAESVASARSTPAREVAARDACADWFTVAASAEMMTGGLPRLASSAMAVPPPPAAGRKRKAFHQVPATRRRGLAGKIARNVRTLQRVQQTHNKFLALAHHVENEAPIPAYLTSMSSDEESDYPSDDEVEPREPARHPLARISGASAHEHASYNVRMLLAHHGFEGGHRAAVDVLTDALGEFMGNLGRMLRIYSDRYASSMSAEEMVLHTLHEGGGADVRGLENYIRNDVERSGTKTAELLRKLRSSYREQFSLSTERGVIEDEALFADNGEALVAGNFAEDLGDDYFGFRELGLDKELGMSGLTVPTRLFYGRARASNTAMAARGAVKEEVLAYPPPPEPVALTAAAVGSQIALLHGFYQDRLREHRQRVKHAHEQAAEEEEREQVDPVVAAATLPEHEQEKQRYKVPPTGKMPRRIMWSAALERKQAAERVAAEKPSVPPPPLAAKMSTGGTVKTAKKGELKKNAITA